MATRFRRCLRIGLRAFLLMIAAVAIMLGYLRQRAEQQRLAVEWVESQEGRVTYKHYLGKLKPVDVWYESGTEEDEQQWRDRIPTHPWYVDAIGKHYFHQAHAVSLSQRTLTGDPRLLTRVHGLRRLSFFEVPIDEPLMATIGKCRSLQTLEFIDCPGGQRGWSHLANLRLKQLYLREAELDRDALRVIGSIHSLERLEFPYCSFEAEDFAELAALSRLKFLGLLFTSVGDEQLVHLANFPELVRLELGPQVTDAGLKHLAKLHNLEEVIFAQSAVTDDAIEIVSDLPKLKSLHLSNCLISNEKFKAIMAKHPALQISYVR